MMKGNKYMKQIVIKEKTLLAIVRLLPDLCIHTKFAADTYLLAISNSIIGEMSKEKHTKATQLIHNVKEVLKEIKAEIE